MMASKWKARDLRRRVPEGFARAGSKGRWLNLARHRLLARDGRVCAACGIAEHRAVGDWLNDPGAPFPFIVDHVAPLAGGGAHALDNMQLLCPRCHRAKTAAEVQLRK
jgi:5-methylcytosine-specific restriction enzyme A